MTTLTDADIQELMAKSELIKNGDTAQLSGACYELRLGNVYYDLTENDRPIMVNDDGQVLIKPGHRVVLITHEELEIPNDILARVVSKGSLFSIGLNPVATYADPGFGGNLGIVTQNISDKYPFPVTPKAAAPSLTYKAAETPTEPLVGSHAQLPQSVPATI